MFSININLNAQVCTAKILQNDTTICAGDAIKITVSINDSSDNCSTYSLSSSLKNGLLGWFPFCGNTNDISPNGNNGFGTGPLTYTTDRYNNPNTAIQFTGNGESVRTNKIDRTTTNSFSYVVWVNTPNVVTLPAETINPASGFSTDLATSCVIHAVHGYNWNLNDQHTGAGLYISNNGVFVVEHAASIVSTPLSWPGSLNGWHSITLVYDNHVPKLYVDGNFIKNGLVTPYTVHPSLACDSFYNAGSYPYLGTGFGKGFNPSVVSVPFNNFKGVIDDIKIYNRALSPAEISELYAKDKSTVLWSTGDTSRTITVMPTGSMDYSVAVTNNLGTCRDTIHISVKNCAIAKCGTTGIINNDTTVCKGANLQLKAKKAFAYSWYPKKGLSDATIQNPVATIDTASVYYLTSSVLLNNLVQNGDFEQGNTSFSSQYIYCNSYYCLFPEGYYAVGPNPTFFQVGFFGKDHTTGAGNLMVVNGASTPNVSVWCQTINVKPNTKYIFSSWLSNMVVGYPAQLQFSINGTPLGNVFTAPNNQYEWKEFYEAWNSGSNTTATICIVNQNTSPFGNDFGLDDIFFGQIDSCIDSVRIKTIAATAKNISASICAGQIYTFPSGVKVDKPGVYKDTLRSSGGCDSIISTITLKVLTPSLKTIDASICTGQNYTLPSGIKVDNPGVYKDTLRSSGGCDSIISTITLKVLTSSLKTVDASICVGQNYKLPSGKIVSGGGSYKDTLYSKAGCDSIISTINLSVYGSPSLKNITASICPYQSYTLPSGAKINKSGVYKDTIKSIAGCDSSITVVNLSVYENPVQKNFAVSICESQSYQLPWGLFINQAGVYRDTLHNKAGCDSIIFIAEVNYAQPKINSTTISICSGDTYLLPWGINVNTEGAYNDTIRNRAGCDSVINSIVLSIRNSSGAGISKSGDINCASGTSTLSAHNGISYEWWPASSLSNSQIANPVASPVVSTRYHVRVKDSYGCVSEDSIDVKVNVANSDNLYLLPNAFTPNGDGLNDCFGIAKWGMVSDLDFSVYDRWGNMVFHTNNSSNCWDGTYKNEPANTGVFIYIIRANTGCGNIYRKGTLLLMR